MTTGTLLPKTHSFYQFFTVTNDKIEVMTDFNINERLKLDLNAKIQATRIDYTYKEI